MTPALIRARDLSKSFERGSAGWFGRARSPVWAVRGVSLDVYPGETYGLVGESGSGKSSLGRLMLRLVAPDMGTVEFDGKDITHSSARELRPLRRRMQIIFQDPYSSLNPRMTVRDTLAEPLRVHRIVVGQKEVEERVRQLAERVGLRADQLDRYPHEFSGGQRQRIGIARALALRPDFVVCDEPVSALDVSIQAQILNLLQDLQQELGVAYLFVSHDLRVVEHVAHRVGVMYRGRIVEEGPTRELYARPAHPYTRRLLAAIPSFDTSRSLPIVLDAPERARSQGCSYAPHCDRFRPGTCDAESPSLIPIADAPTHQVACYFPG